MASTELSQEKRQEMAEGLKRRGLEALNAGALVEAIKSFTEGLEYAPQSYVLYIDRCAVYTRLAKFEEALADAEMVISLAPRWVKGYIRKGFILSKLERYEEAMMAYMEGLSCDPKNELCKKGMKSAKSHLTGAGEDDPLVSPFADPQVWDKLSSNRRTKKFLYDSDFRDIVNELQKNPKELKNYIQDSRVMEAVGVLMNVDLHMPTAKDITDEDYETGRTSPVKEAPLSGPRITEITDDQPVAPARHTGPTITEVADDGPLHKGPTVTEIVDDEPPKPPARPSKKKKSSPTQSENTSCKNQKFEPAGSNDAPAELDDAAKALKEKEAGNAAYKKKDFETALQHYGKAIELDPSSIVFRNNRSAVYFEQGEYDMCIKECEDAVEVGREHRADYKLIAKALARIGSAYVKKEDLKSAVTYFNKSLSEFRDPAVVKKAAEVDKTLKEKERLAYIDPTKADEEKQKGNEAFKKGDYPTAIKQYTEAIKRNPEDAKIYSNRAACYTKLAEFHMALKDCDQCIRLDPKFVKGYLRKGGILMGLKEFSKASDAYQKAINLDPNCQEALDGYRKCAMSESSDPEAIKKRAMNDPEIQQILGDPAMQLILGQMQKDPKALQEHLKNPEVSQKIQKLLECGLIGIR